MKSAVQSKTLWFNILNAVILALQGTTDTSIVSPEVQVWATIIGNAALRFVTSTEVSLTGK